MIDIDTLVNVLSVILGFLMLMLCPPFLGDLINWFKRRRKSVKQTKHDKEEC